MTAFFYKMYYLITIFIILKGKTEYFYNILMSLKTNLKYVLLTYFH